MKGRKWWFNEGRVDRRVASFSRKIASHLAFEPFLVLMATNFWRPPATELVHERAQKKGIDRSM